MKKPSKSRHKYDYKVRPRTAAAKVVHMVDKDKRVLELGPGPGSITNLLGKKGCRVTALEVDENAISIVKEHCESVRFCDLNDPNWTSILANDEKYQVVVAGDVLEHLYDPWKALQSVHNVLQNNGYLVVSLPHIGHSAVIACLLNSDFEYQPWGLLDKTHIRFFGLKNIQKLFNESGFKIVEADFVIKAPEQTEFAKSWRRLPKETRKILSDNMFGSVYQVVVKAVPLSSPGKSLELTSLALPYDSNGTTSAGSQSNRVSGYLLSLISLRNREKISRILEKIGISH